MRTDCYTSSRLCKKDCGLYYHGDAPTTSCTALALSTQVCHLMMVRFIAWVYLSYREAIGRMPAMWALVACSVGAPHSAHSQTSLFMCHQCRAKEKKGYSLNKGLIVRIPRSAMLTQSTEPEQPTSIHSVAVPPAHVSAYPTVSAASVAPSVQEHPTSPILLPLFSLPLKLPSKVSVQNPVLRILLTQYQLAHQSCSIPPPSILSPST